MGNKPSCNEFRLMADEYTDGSLQGAKLERFEDHIKNCEECKAYLDELRALKKAVSDSAEEVPDGLHLRIMDAVHTEMKKNPPRRKHRFIKGAAISAACATICFSLVLMIVMLPLWRDASSGETPRDEMFEESPSSAAGALPNETDSYEKDDHTPETNEETYLADENNPLVGGNTGAAPAETASPEFDETKHASDEMVSEEEKNEDAGTVRVETLASNQNSNDENEQLSPEVNASDSSVPGGNEITMALLIVSGLLAVASFIAFLISLSSIRTTPQADTKTNKEEKK